MNSEWSDTFRLDSSFSRRITAIRELTKACTRRWHSRVRVIANNSVVKLMDNAKGTRRSKVIGEFGEAFCSNWLSRSDFEVTIVDHSGLDIIAYRTPTLDFAGGKPTASSRRRRRRPLFRHSLVAGTAQAGRWAGRDDRTRGRTEPEDDYLG